MLPLLVLLVRSEYQCKFETPNVLSDIISTISTYFKSVPMVFGFEVSLQLPNMADLIKSQSIKGAMPYIIGLGGFIIPVALFTICIVAYFLFGQIASLFPPFYAKTSKKISCQAGCNHIFLSFILIIAIALFFFAASQISIGMMEVGKVPSGILNVVDTVQNTLTDTANVVSSSVINLVNYSTVIYKNTTNLFKTSLDNMQQLSQQVGNDLTPANQYAQELKTKAEEFDTKINQFCPGKVPFIFKKIDRTKNVDTKVSKLINAYSAYDTGKDKFLQANVGFKKAHEVYKDDILPLVENFSSDSFDNMIQIINNATSNITTVFNHIDDYLGYVEKYTNLVIYSIISIFTIITLIYTFIFFCRCFLARCLSTYFCSFGLVVSVIIGIPNIVFSLALTFFHSECPSIEFAINEVGTELFSPTSEFRNLLLCPDTIDDNSLFALSGLSYYFDYIEASLNLSRDVNKYTFDLQAKDSLELLRDITDNSLSNIESDSFFIGFNTSEAKQTIEQLTPEMCPTLTTEDKVDLNNIIAQMQASSNQIKDVIKGSTNFKKLDEFSVKAYGLTEEAIDLNRMLPDRISNTVYDEISKGSLKANCTLICPLYTPAKNAVCVNLVNGFAWWFLSTAFMLIGLFSMSISICNRRKGMLPPKVEVTSSSSSSYDVEYGSYSDY